MVRRLHRIGVTHERRQGQLPNNLNSDRRNRDTSGNRKRIGPSGSTIRNLILSQIPDSEFRLVLPHLESIETKEYQILHEPGERLNYAYFPNRGMVCVVTELSDSKTLEVAVATKTGFAGESIAIGRNWCPYRLVTQPPVEGLRVKADVLMGLLHQTPELWSNLTRSMKFQSMRTAQIAACNRFHEIEQRLARWLLMSQDRIGSPILPFTHDFLANMLGAGRGSITIAAGILQKAGMIRYHRGAIKVTNRRKLEEAVCECYKTIKQFESVSER